MSSSLGFDGIGDRPIYMEKTLAQATQTKQISTINFFVSPYDEKRFNAFSKHQELIVVGSGRVNVSETFRYMVDFFLQYSEAHPEEMSEWTPLAPLKVDNKRAEAKLAKLGVRLASHEDCDHFEQHAVKLGISQVGLAYNVVQFFFQKHQDLMNEIMGKITPKKFNKTIKKRGNEIPVRASEFRNADFLLNWRNAPYFLDNAEGLTTQQELCEHIFDAFNAAVATHRSEKGAPYPMVAAFKTQGRGQRRTHAKANTVVTVLLGVPAADRCNNLAASVYVQSKTYYYNGILWAIEHYDIANVRLAKERAEGMAKNALDVDQKYHAAPTDEFDDIED